MPINLFSSTISCIYSLFLSWGQLLMFYMYFQSFFSAIFAKLCNIIKMFGQKIYGKQRKGFQFSQGTVKQVNTRFYSLILKGIVIYDLQSNKQTKLMWKNSFVILLIIAIVGNQVRCVGHQMGIIKKITSKSSMGIFNLGKLATAQTLTLKSLIRDGNITAILSNKIDLYKNNLILPLTTKQISIGPSNLQLFLYVNDFIPKFSIQVKLGCVVLSSLDQFAYGSYARANFYAQIAEIVQINKFIQVKNNCILQADFSTLSKTFEQGRVSLVSKLKTYDLSSATEIQNGIYKIQISKQTLDYPYYLSFYSFQDNPCQIEQVYHCSSGSNALNLADSNLVRLERGQKCAIKIQNCRNGRIQCGELCDNTNPGCGINCQPEKGYECFPKVNRCRLKCGNNILDEDQECDNRNEQGCINCVVQEGWDCQTDMRYCFRIDGECGNGQKQIEQQCDDGQTTDDGCNRQCKVENGYICQGGLGEKSYCFRIARL